MLHCCFRSNVSSFSSDSSVSHPLLAPCLKGLGKFSHLIDLDFMGDIMGCLKKLAGLNGSQNSSPGNCLSVSERLQCCIVAFRVMKKNLDALNIDLQEFYAHLYNLLLEYRPDRLVYQNHPDIYPPYWLIVSKRYMLNLLLFNISI